jgi:putative inorganic carbon (HCO3(-)) transporter
LDVIGELRAVPWRSLLRGPWRDRLALLAALSVLAFFLAWAPLEASAIVLAGSGLALALAVRPAVGLVALALLIPLGGVLPLPLPWINGVDLLVAAVTAGWLAHGIARRRIHIRWPPLLWPLLALVWVMALSLTQAQSWREGIPELLKWAEFAALYFVAAQILSARHTWWVIGALILAGLLQVGLGAYQFIKQVGPPAFLLAGRFMRAYGAFRQPNPYAGYLGYLAPVAASLSLAGFEQWWHSRARHHLAAGLIGGVVALALALGIGMSWSRGGWIALGAALIAVIGLRSRRTVFLMLAAGLVAGFVAVGLAQTGWLPASVTARVSDLGGYLVGPDPARTEITDENFAVLERLAHWQTGLRMFADRPWLGVGIGNYGDAYASYAPPHWYEPLGHAHNLFINFLAETGVIGGAAFGAFWLGAWWLAWKTTKCPRAYATALSIGVIGTLGYLTVHNLFDNLFVQHMHLQLALLLGCIVALNRPEEPS